MSYGFGTRRIGDGTVEFLWAFLRAPAIHVAIARDAFVFDISWLGIVLVVGALLLFRYLRR